MTKPAPKPAPSPVPGLCNKPVSPSGNNRRGQLCKRPAATCPYHKGVPEMPAYLAELLK